VANEDPNGLEIVPTRGALGAELRGLDPGAAPDPALGALLRRALARHGMLFARGVDLDEAAQLRLTACLGEPLPYPDLDSVSLPLSPSPDPDAPATIAYLVHDPGVAPRSGDLGFGELPWHSDLQYLAEPPLYTLLYAIEAPGRGGETQFADVAQAWRALPLRERWRLRGVEADYVRGAQRHRHALRRRHPVSGETVLFMSAYAVKLHRAPRARRVQWLDDLKRHVASERFVWTHAWQPGDLLFWDNVRVIHRRLPFDAAAPRRMRRTQATHAGSA
jgi:alpha-ketoglutarate-dependent taurine dioxygenase